MADNNNNLPLEDIIKPKKKVVVKPKKKVAENIIDKPKKTRQSRKIVFKKEREELLQKMYDILGVTKDNKKIYLYDVENGKVDAIMALQEDVRKYFNAGNWAIFCKDNVVRPHMSLIRSILKDMDVRFYTIGSLIKRNNEKIHTTRIEIV